MPAQDTYKVLVFDNYDGIGNLILDHSQYDSNNQSTLFATALNSHHSVHQAPIMKKYRRYMESGVGSNRTVYRNMVTEIVTNEPFQQYIECPMPSLISGKGILVFHETLIDIPSFIESMASETLTWDEAVTAGHVIE